MRQKGFTVTELLIVIAIISVLLAVGTMQFNRMSEKSNIEGQVNKLYSDLIKVRSEALFQKRERAVTLLTTGYAVYSSSTTTGTPVSQQSFSKAITWDGGNKIVFTTQGMTTPDAKAICVNAGSTASFDSVMVTTSRIHIGKRTGDCTSGNITLR